MKWSRPLCPLLPDTAHPAADSCSEEKRHIGRLQLDRSGLKCVYHRKSRTDILPVVTKRLIDVDDTLLEQAGGVLRTRTMKDTVNQALAEVVRAELRRRHADRLVRMDGLEIDDSEVMAGAWRS